jgi:hypothetical protein
MAMFGNVITPYDTPPHVAGLIQSMIAPTFQDVRTMLQLPRPDLGMLGGCNFQIGNTLFNLASGLSALLFRQNSRDSGAAFKRFFTEHYWVIDPPEGATFEDASDLMYRDFRNPMVHILGLSSSGFDDGDLIPFQGARRIKFKKHEKGLDSHALQSIEMAEQRPVDNSPTLVVRETSAVLDCTMFYWGMRRVLELILQNREIVDGLEKRLIDFDEDFKVANASGAAPKQLT